MSWSKDLVAASATPLVLSVLAQGESYGYEIIKRVREASGAEIQWTDGMLYPVLHRLERQGLIESEWRSAENRRRRKYYRMRKKGMTALQRQRAEWEMVDGVFSHLWRRKSCSI